MTKKTDANKVQSGKFTKKIAMLDRVTPFCDVSVHKNEFHRVPYDLAHD